jgi:16S rRNA (guanine(527)-N(7))-methyltransferase RsmG
MKIEARDWAEALEFFGSIGAHNPVLSSPDFQKQSIQYLELLLQKNQEVNLTGAKDLSTAFWKHLVDSLALLSLGDLGTLVDWGSGGGLPGVPLALARKHSGDSRKVHFVDSVGKKIRAIEEFCVALELPNACGHIGRGELLLRSGSLGPVDTVVMRAVAPAERAYHWVSNHASQWILFLGPNQVQDWKAYGPRLLKAKMKIDDQKTFHLPRDLGERVLLRISKSST